MKIIIMYDHDESMVLFQEAKSISISYEGLKKAKYISNALIQTLLPFMPAAGLAAKFFQHEFDLLQKIENIMKKCANKIILIKKRFKKFYVKC